MENKKLEPGIYLEDDYILVQVINEQKKFKKLQFEIAKLWFDEKMRK
jgi:hypothetical protein